GVAQPLALDAYGADGGLGLFALINGETVLLVEQAAAAVAAKGAGDAVAVLQPQKALRVVAVLLFDGGAVDGGLAVDAAQAPFAGAGRFQGVGGAVAQGVGNDDLAHTVVAVAVLVVEADPLGAVAVFAADRPAHGVVGPAGETLAGGVIEPGEGVGVAAILVVVAPFGLAPAGGEAGPA